MKNLTDYIKECLDVENFEYKFKVWFDSDKSHYQPMLEFLKELSLRKIVTRDDIDDFLLKNSKFQIKKFVDFFDEDVKRDEAINVDYIYLFTKIVENFITNFNLKHVVDYGLQAKKNGEPNVDVESAPMANEKEEK